MLHVVLNYQCIINTHTYVVYTHPHTHYTIINIVTLTHTVPKHTQTPSQHTHTHTYTHTQLQTEPHDKFSIIMLVYNRTNFLLRLLNHYAAMTDLDLIVVVWNNNETAPPLEQWIALGPHPVGVAFKVQSENKLRNRLQHFPEIKTAGEPRGYCYLMSRFYLKGGEIIPTSAYSHGNSCRQELLMLETHARC